MATLLALYNDDAGFIVSIELILISTIAVIGLITGFNCHPRCGGQRTIRRRWSSSRFESGYSYNGVLGHSGSTNGSSWTDRLDWCDSAEDEQDNIDNCIVFFGPSDEI